MMRILTLTILALSSAIFCWAQQWSCIYSGDTTYYLNDQLQFSALLVVDSSTSSGVTTFKVFRGFSKDTVCDFSGVVAGNPYVYEGYNVNTPTWPGPVIERLTGGHFLFYNSRLDTIRIQSLATLNDSWVMYDDGAGSFLEATIVSEDTATIAGSIDSVKSILLRSYSTGITAIEQWDSTMLVLSSGHGLLDIPYFLNFPDNHKVLRHTEMKPLTYAEVYNYEVGDYFQIERTGVGLFSNTLLTFYQVLSKNYSNGGNTVTYTMLRERQEANRPMIVDTIVKQYDNLKSYVGGGVPGAVTIDSNHVVSLSTLYSYVYTGSDTNLTGRRVAVEAGLASAINENDSCWHWNGIIVDAVNPSTFYECLGSLDSGFGPDGDFDEFLVYYNLCGQTGGTKQFVGIEETLELQVQVYPNPASDRLLIENNSGRELSFVLLNLQGQEVGSGDAEAGATFYMNTASYLPGMYVLQLSNGVQSSFRKIVISR